MTLHDLLEAIAAHTASERSHLIAGRIDEALADRIRILELTDEADQSCDETELDRGDE